MNGRPLSTRKKVQILVAMTILAWATHTLLHQWGYGAVIPGDAPAEKFVPGRHTAVGGTLELRSEASIYGGEVRLKQVCRWSDADAAIFVPVADLVVLRIDDHTSFKPIALNEMRKTLSDAGVNLGNVRFAGPTICTVRRADALPNDANLTMEQWIDARRGITGAPPEAAPAPQRAIPMPVALSVTAEPLVAAAVLPASRPAAAAPGAGPVRSLRSLLMNDLSIRLGIPVEQLQVSFNPIDENLLNLSEPQFRFNLEPRRVRNLGEVEWEVTFVARGGARKSPIVANARAWQSQVVTEKPLTFHQLISPGDVSERRSLVDRVSDEPLLTLAQCVGQQASQDLKPATLMTARMVDPVPMAKPGQLIIITANQGTISIRTVARAMEAGSFGQTIHVKNEATNLNYDVILVGPQEGMIGTAGDAAKLLLGRSAE